MDEGSAKDKSDQGTDKEELLINLDLLRTGFSPQPDGQLIMDGYLSAYTEMNKFFQILGTLFQVVSSDVHSKVEILREYRGGEEGDHYHSIQSMITYEKEHDLLINKNKPSGARTLLRLHRALEFVTEFLAILIDGSMEGSFGKNVSELYSCTLGKFHGMLLRTTFSGALLLIPRRETIINRLTNGSAEAEKVAYAEMPYVIEMMKAIYDHTQKLYEENGLLDLP